MKRCLLTALLAVFAVSLLTPSAFGEQDHDKKWKKDGKKDKHGWAAEKQQEKLESLNLSDELKEKVSQILQNRREAMANWHKEHKGKMAELREKKQAIDKENKALRKSRQEVNKQFTKQLAEAGLSEQQIKKLHGRRDKRPRDKKDRPRYGYAFGRMFAGLDLSDEQMAQIKAIHKDAAEKVKSNVLTTEQREKLAKRVEAHKKRKAHENGEKRDEHPLAEEKRNEHPRAEKDKKDKDPDKYENHDKLEKDEHN